MPPPLCVGTLDPLDPYCTCLQSHLPQPLKSHIQSFGTLGQLSKIPPFAPKNVIMQGNCWNPNILDTKELMKNSKLFQKYLCK